MKMLKPALAFLWLAFVVVGLWLCYGCGGAQAVSPNTVSAWGWQLQQCIDPEAGIAAEEACVNKINAEYCGDGGLLVDSGVCDSLTAAHSAPQGLLDSQAAADHVVDAVTK